MCQLHIATVALLSWQEKHHHPASGWRWPVQWTGSVTGTYRTGGMHAASLAHVCAHCLLSHIHCFTTFLTYVHEVFD